MTSSVESATVATNTDDATDGDGTETRERPADCDCAKLSGEDLPCWPCYRDYFEPPNPDASE